MTDKKRRTVTTIETHEVWIIRKVAPEPTDEAVTVTPLQIAQLDAADSPLGELNNGTEANGEESGNEQRIRVP